jgi:hypothetical protein
MIPLIVQQYVRTNDEIRTLIMLRSSLRVRVFSLLQLTWFSHLPDAILLQTVASVFPLLRDLYLACIPLQSCSCERYCEQTILIATGIQRFVLVLHVYDVQVVFVTVIL